MMTKKFLDLVSQGFDEEDAKNIEDGKLELVEESIEEDAEMEIHDDDEIIDTSNPIA